MKTGKEGGVDNVGIPAKKRREFRNQRIKGLRSAGFSMQEICAEMAKLGESVSKTTVFFVLNGRWTKKAGDRRRLRKLQNKTINKQ